MNILLGTENVHTVDKKYVVLELDTLKINGAEEPVTAYCIVEQVPLNEIPVLEQYTDLHNNLLKNYRKRNWHYCEDAISHLRGRWHGEVDTFYDSLLTRVQQLQKQDPGPDWDGIVNKT